MGMFPLKKQVIVMYLIDDECVALNRAEKISPQIKSLLRKHSNNNAKLALAKAIQEEIKYFGCDVKLCESIFYDYWQAIGSLNVVNANNIGGCLSILPRIIRSWCSDSNSPPEDERLICLSKTISLIIESLIELGAELEEGFNTSCSYCSEAS